MFLVLYLCKCQESLSKTTLMSLNWKIINPTMPTIINPGKLKQTITYTFGAVSMGIVQEKLLLAHRCSIVCNDER